ncbi:hypothetical protein BX616_003589, partial [Lobosporangium transversale]
MASQRNRTGVQPTGNSSSNYDQTQANTLANRRNSADHQAHIAKQRPVTTYSSLIPPPSPTYFRLQEMGGKPPFSSLNDDSDLGRPAPGLPRGELDHLRPLPPSNDNKFAEKEFSWHQKISIWMINE